MQVDQTYRTRRRLQIVIDRLPFADLEGWLGLLIERNRLGPADRITGGEEQLAVAPAIPSARGEKARFMNRRPILKTNDIGTKIIENDFERRRIQLRPVDIAGQHAKEG